MDFVRNLFGKKESAPPEAITKTNKAPMEKQGKHEWVGAMQKLDNLASDGLT